MGLVQDDPVPCNFQQGTFVAFVIIRPPFIQVDVLNDVLWGIAFRVLTHHFMICSDDDTTRGEGLDDVGAQDT